MALPLLGFLAAAALSESGHQRAHAPQRPLSAEQLVRRSAQAIGGVDQLRAIGGVRVEEGGHEYLITIPGDPRGPRRFAVQTIASLRRADPLAVRQTVDNLFPMRPGHFAQTTVATARVAGVIRSGAMVPGATSDLESAMDESALAPERVLLTALGASGLRVERDSTIDGTSYHMVSFPLSSGRVTLAINARTSFPDRVRLEREYPAVVYWAMWGRVTIETVWSSWSAEPSGVWYPRQRTVTFNGMPFREYTVTSLDLAAPTPADSFAIPDSVASRFAAATAAPARDPQLTPVTLADGITLFQGGYQAALVREPAGVIVIEGPESDAKSRAVLQQSERLYPGVPVTAVVTTSPAWMHIGGLAEYARRGIPIYALDMNTAEVAALLSAPHAARDGGNASPPRDRMIPVRDSITLGSGENRMALIPARGIHGAAMMLVYWPAHRLLYASDVIIPPAFEPTFTRAYDADLRRAIDRLQLPVSTVFALHLPAAPWPPSADSGVGATQPTR